MTNEEPLPKKVRLSETDFKVMARDELILRWKRYEAYAQALEGKYTDLNSNDVTGLRESEEKRKQQQQESARRENIIVMQLATKEQEMQECTTQIQYLKQVQQPSIAQLRSTMIEGTRETYSSIIFPPTSDRHFFRVEKRISEKLDMSASSHQREMKVPSEKTPALLSA
ncbi:hypothetical protein EI555_010096 [Monodon monoceros]|uniref:Pre-mRNA-splicing regulator WTAP n=1 Tax=Monodon monoceros TaxID=40151 RepID=A0A4U1EFC7_MONMO|nr:hypothetical protein EI555_010096 [Monodon monoceros]